MSRCTHPGIQGIAFSPGGGCVATVGGTLLRLWRVSDGIELANAAHAKTVNAVTFAEDASLIITASDDQTARVWTPVASPA